MRYTTNRCNQVVADHGLGGRVVAYAPQMGAAMVNPSGFMEFSEAAAPSCGTNCCSQGSTCYCQTPAGNWKNNPGCCQGAKPCGAQSGGGANCTGVCGNFTDDRGKTYCVCTFGGRSVYSPGCCNGSNIGPTTESPQY